MNKLRYLLIVVTILLVHSSAWGVADYFLGEFTVPSANTFPTGITYDETNLLITQFNSPTNTIYIVTTTGTEVGTFDVAGGMLMLQALAYDDVSDNVWALGTAAKSVYEVDPSDGSVLSSFALDAANAAGSGITLHDGSLYVSNNSTISPYIYEYSTTGTLLSSFTSFAKKPAGLDYIDKPDAPDAGDYFFNIGNDDGYMVIHDADDGAVNLDFTYKISSPCNNSEYGGDFTFKDNEFSGSGAVMWHVDYANRKVYELEVDWQTGIETQSLGVIKSLYR